MFAFAGLEPSTLIALAALALTIGLLLRRSHRYLARQDKNLPPIVRTARPETRKHSHHLGAPDEMLQWEVEMHDVARDLSAQLDSKMGLFSRIGIVHTSDIIATQFRIDLGSPINRFSLASGPDDYLISRQRPTFD